jgi:hypothetical protein
VDEMIQRLVYRNDGAYGHPASCEAEGDAAFFVAAHNALPQLLDRLSAAEARVKELEGALIPPALVYTLWRATENWMNGCDLSPGWRPTEDEQVIIDASYKVAPYFVNPDGSWTAFAAAAAARAEKEGDRNAQ